LNTNDGVVALLHWRVTFLNKATVVSLFSLSPLLSKRHYPEVVAGVMRLEVAVNEVLVMDLVVLIALVEFDPFIDDEDFRNLDRILQLLRP